MIYSNNRIILVVLTICAIAVSSEPMSKSEKAKEAKKAKREKSSKVPTLRPTMRTSSPVADLPISGDVLGDIRVIMTTMTTMMVTKLIPSSGERCLLMYYFSPIPLSTITKQHTRLLPLRRLDLNEYAASCKIVKPLF